MRFTFQCLVAFLIISSVSGCGKDADPDPLPVDPSTFSVKINGTNWTPKSLDIFYYSKYDQLSFVASDDKKRVNISIDFDPSKSIGNYFFGAFGGNVAKMEDAGASCYSYFDIPDAGGNLTISSSNLAEKKISGAGSLVTYSVDKLTKLELTDIRFNNVVYKTDTGNFSSGNAAYTITGKKSNSIVTKDIYGELFCPNPTRKTIASIKITGPIVELQDQYLLIELPFDGQKGSFPIEPKTTRSVTCGRLGVLSTFNFHNSSDLYQPSSGSVTITVSDTTAQVIRGTFNMVLSKASNPLDKIVIQNGQFNVSTWR